ncbi:actin-like protein ARP6 [Gilbertella persicaria]|uniref:actin-like protein ARP6 n=1 Tax=Gilbertella persicaria TaxID=101096 RepID=UPI00221EA1D2|nr:actin-like protein ARP6 [Gilbertella persicaria]KAI8090104.1 actin-like protein ARP6 [Gilbertella persicaria]
MAPPTTTLVVDNGAYTIKAALANKEAIPRLVSNAIVRGKTDKRNYIGDELDTCTDFSSLYYRLPFERGLLTNWNIERSIWHRLFKHVMQIDPKETRLLVTEPCFNLPAIQDGYDQVIFEEYEFNACHRTMAPQLCLYNDLGGLFGDNAIPDCTLIVDSGFSFTHIVPFLKGSPIPKGIRRLNVGGKLLTNHLKEVVSFRSYDMMEETYIINDVKEKCCFMSHNVYDDLDICKKQRLKNTIVQEYVLPDFIHHATGHIRTGNSPTGEQQQILAMNNERFMIPEILMHPSDIGLEQAGIPEAITQSVSACDSEIHGLLYANIVLIGGNANIPGYKERIEHDLRQFVPDEFEIRLAIPKDPVTYAWEGGNQFISLSSKAELQRTFVQRKEYLEYGSNICRRKFGSL